MGDKVRGLVGLRGGGRGLVVSFVTSGVFAEVGRNISIGFVFYVLQFETVFTCVQSILVNAFVAVKLFFR